MTSNMTTIHAPELADVPAPVVTEVTKVDTRTIEEKVAAIFAIDTADHQLTVLHDDGLYRHIRLARPGTGLCHFDLITWPGYLSIAGDCDSFVFSRVTDMFTFFRGNRINLSYWAEKERTGAKTRKHSEDMFRQAVSDHFVDCVKNGEAPRGLGKAIREDIFDSWEHDISHEEGARQALADFDFKGFRFHDVWEWEFEDWGWHFVRACHAIQWGIAQYDAHKAAQAVSA